MSTVDRSSSSFPPGQSSSSSSSPSSMGVREEVVDRAVRFLGSTEASLHPEAARHFLQHTLKLGNEEISLAYERLRNPSAFTSSSSFSPSSSSLTVPSSVTKEGITDTNGTVNSTNNPGDKVGSGSDTVPKGMNLSTPPNPSLPSSSSFSSPLPTSTVIPSSSSSSSSSTVESAANRRIKILSNILQYATLGATAGYFWKVYDITNRIQTFMDVSSSSPSSSSSSSLPSVNTTGPTSTMMLTTMVPTLSTTGTPNVLTHQSYPQPSPFSSSYTMNNNNYPYPYPPQPSSSFPMSFPPLASPSLLPSPYPHPPTGYDNVTSPSTNILPYHAGNTVSNVTGSGKPRTIDTPSSSSSLLTSTTTLLADHPRNDEFQKTIEDIRDMEQQTKHSVQALQLLLENMNHTVSTTLTTMNKQIQDTHNVMTETKSLHSTMHQTVHSIQHEVHTLIEQQQQNNNNSTNTSIRSGSREIGTTSTNTANNHTTMDSSSFTTPNKSILHNYHTNTNEEINSRSTIPTVTTNILPTVVTMMNTGTTSDHVPILSPINSNNTSTAATTPFSTNDKPTTIIEPRTKTTESVPAPIPQPPSPTKETILADVRNALLNIIAQNDTSTLINGINTLIMAVRNMIENPHATRYRRIPMVNDHFRKKLGIIKQHESVFKALGFAPIDDVWKWQPWLLSSDKTEKSSKNGSIDLLAMEFEAFLLPSIDILKDIVPILQQTSKELSEKETGTKDTVPASEHVASPSLPPPAPAPSLVISTTTTNSNTFTASSEYTTPVPIPTATTDTSSTSGLPNRIPRPSVGTSGSNPSVFSASSVRSSSVGTTSILSSSIINATNAPPEILARAQARSRSGSLSAGIGPSKMTGGLGNSRLSRSRSGSRVSLGSMVVPNTNTYDQDTLGLQNMDLFLNDLAASAVHTNPPRSVVEPISPPGLSMDTLLRNSTINNPLPSSPVNSLPSVVTSPASSVRQSLGGGGGGNTTGNNRFSVSSETNNRLNNSNEVLLLDSSHLVPSPIKNVNEGIPIEPEKGSTENTDSVTSFSSPIAESVKDSASVHPPTATVPESTERDGQDSPQPLTYKDIVKYIETNRIDELPGVQEFEEKLSVLATNPNVFQPQVLAPPKPWETVNTLNSTEGIVMIDNVNNSNDNDKILYTGTSSVVPSAVISSNDLLFTNDEEINTGSNDDTPTTNLSQRSVPLNPPLLSTSIVPTTDNLTQSSLSLSTNSIMDTQNSSPFSNSGSNNTKVSVTSPVSTTKTNIELRESKSNSAGRERRPSLPNVAVPSSTGVTVPRTTTVPTTAAPPAYRVGRYDT